MYTFDQYFLCYCSILPNFLLFLFSGIPRKTSHIQTALEEVIERVKSLEASSEGNKNLEKDIAFIRETSKQFVDSNAVLKANNDVLLNDNISLRRDNTELKTEVQKQRNQMLLLDRKIKNNAELILSFDKRFKALESGKFSFNFYDFCFVIIMNG